MSASFVPPFSPLLVRSPNLNAWLPSPASREHPWARHWSRLHLPLGMMGTLRVDNETFIWLGDPEDNGNSMDLVEQTMTPTSTRQSLHTDKLDMNITFLSPIEPDSLARQSFPFSYISVDLKANDDGPHEVQILLDMQGQWLSERRETNITTSAHNEDSVVYLQAAPDDLSNMKWQVTNRRSDDATLYFGMPVEDSTNYEIGNLAAAREAFSTGGKLSNQAISDPRPIDDGTNVLSLSLSKDFGAMESDSTANALFTVGIVRDPSIGFTRYRGADPEERSPCFKTEFEDVGAALRDFIGDFASARERASAFDDRIMNPAKEISDNVADLVAMTTRTVMASMDVTCGSDSDDVMFFVDSMGSLHGERFEDGDGYVNRVDDLYASWPAIMTINPTFGRYILEPLLTFQSKGSGMKEFALPDLGNTYPEVTGGNPDSDEAVNLGVEESANMLLMIWAQVYFSNESTLVDKYYDVFSTWADYLVDRVPTPGSTGHANSADENASDTPNLAIKAILGIRAMAELSQIHGDSDAADDYFARANTLYSDWEVNAMPGDHVLWKYGAADSWGLTYNLYPDKWLGLDLVSDKVYDAQDQWYSSNLSVSTTYGLPYDSTQTDVKSHWTSFTAAIVKSTSTRDRLMESIRSYALVLVAPIVLFGSEYSLNLDTQGLPTDATGEASPVLGSMFALTALNLEPKRQTYYGTGGTSSGSSSGGPNIGAIAGGTVGGVVALILAILLFFFCRRRRANQQDSDAESEVKATSPETVHPFVLPQNSRTAAQPNTYLESRARKTSRGLDSPVSSSQSPTTAETPTPATPPPPLVPLRSGEVAPEQVHSSSGNQESTTTPRIHEEIEGLRRDVRQILTHYDPPPQY